MSSKKSEFRVEIEGPEKSVEQFYHVLRKLKGEGERSGVDVTVERINTTEPEEPPEFD